MTEFSLGRRTFAAAFLFAVGLPCFGQKVSVIGAGSTFTAPMYSKWFAEYHKLHPSIELNYQSIGSGGGISKVTDGSVDFGASDGPMTDDEIKRFREKQGSGVLHFPTVLGADVPSYNVPGVTGDLNFTQEALAGIFLGTITKWNDPELTKANPAVKLPAENIVVVHRSDGSGTTYVWADYLSKISPQWKSKVGVATTVSWPVGLSGRGNEGVAGWSRKRAIRSDISSLRTPFRPKFLSAMCVIPPGSSSRPAWRA
jgi:phosphate transport system substrate-binding protein